MKQWGKGDIKEETKMAGGTNPLTKVKTQIQNQRQPTIRMKTC